MAPPTILAHKTTFLTGQTLQLSQNLTPSHAWRMANDGAEQSISERILDDALYRLNHTLQQHARRAYPPQATRHVAEQIDSLFLGAEPVVDIDSDPVPNPDPDERLRDGIDLALDQSIASLPHTWDTHRPDESEAAPLEARRYMGLRKSMAELSTRRASTKARVERLRHVENLLTPFKPMDRIQENLVTRNGEVEKELERMRVLLVRVAGRIVQLPDTSPKTMVSLSRGDGVEDLDHIERAKVQMLLSEL
ncbi:kinetochore Sim4 complex subunit Fta4 [Xylariales sp. AK1849]|nr:kinetochore Sim4 complex subunit Fta4 [Xylariales sp. AK1849]